MCTKLRWPPRWADSHVEFLPNWYCRVCLSAEKYYKGYVTAYKYGGPRYSTEAFYFILQKIIEGRRRRLRTSHHWTCGHGENRLPSKVVVGANVTMSTTRSWHCAFLPGLFFSVGWHFHCQANSKSFLLNLTLPSVTPSWIASLSLRMLKTLT